jgi:hypothetical protein
MEFTRALRIAPKTPREAAWPICTYAPHEVDVLHDDIACSTAYSASILSATSWLVLRLCASDIAALSSTCRAAFAAVRNAWNLLAPPVVVTAVRSRDEHGHQPWRMLILHQPRIAPASGMLQLWDSCADADADADGALATAKWWAVVALPDGQRALLQVLCGRVTACVSVREWRAKRCAHVQIDDEVAVASGDVATATVTRAGAIVASRVTVLKLFLVTTQHESSAKRPAAAAAPTTATSTATPATATPTAAAATTATVLLYKKQPTTKSKRK